MVIPNNTSNQPQRLYGDLAWIWPIISPPQDYAEETEHFCRLIREQSRIEVKTLLDLGRGGGHNDFTLKKHFELTGVDASTAMLALAKQLNPDVAYSCGDMRTVQLGKTFDAVTIFDSISYMTKEEDLRAAFASAFMHLEPGGVFLTFAEETSERFEQNRTRCSKHAQSGVEIILVENIFDPDPTDTMYVTTFVFLIRRGEQFKVETDRHLSGIFKMEVWLGLLREIGFKVMQSEFTPPGLEGKSIPMFVCLKS
ncbi:MAG: class I SAM-dependent DNA methyltransferase [Bacteroidota bacterium]